MSFTCDHLYTIDNSLSKELLLNRQKMGCSWCGTDRPDLWLCLFAGCLKIGCGVHQYNHSYLHNMERQSHCIYINLSNYRLWCYACKIEFNTRSIGKMEADPSQQQHLGTAINTCDIAKAEPVINSDSSSEDEDEDSVLLGNVKPKGLVGLRNLGLTCYMNAALQALSNSLPLATYMNNISSSLKEERRIPAIVKPFNKLLQEIWHKKRPSSIAPFSLYQNFKSLYPMFRPYTQQDSQEFLRYFMDQLHEELKEPHLPMVDNEDDQCKDLSEDADMSSLDSDSICGSISTPGSNSECEIYETCESGVSDVGSPVSRLNRRKRKRSKSSGFPSNSWINVSPGIKNENELYYSEIDTTSDASIVTRRNLRSKRISGSSSSTSGIGSSKPSVYSLSSATGKTSAWMRHNKCNATAKPNAGAHRKKKPVLYKSIITDIFDGVLVSSVQCLTCNRVSSRKETFQDLSLPIPSAEQLGPLEHTTQQSRAVCSNNSSNLHGGPRVPCDINNGWVWLWFIWFCLWLRSWVWGPAVSLMHCLAAFSSDELKGENMYSCEKCSKLRNGVKFSRFLELPETLIVHLKRFRHEYMFSSKINQYVSFPLHDLDLTPFLHKDCKSSVHKYDLYAVICHHGAVGSGHYTTCAKNATNDMWYEFDDQCVTEISQETVASCEAYVLFYKKNGSEMSDRRQRTVELLQVSSNEPSLMNFYISKEWVNKFNTFSEPGLINNLDFLCPHGGVQPIKSAFVSDMVMELSQGVWEYLHQAFGGGPACTKLYECVTCRDELNSLHQRQFHELQTFIELHKRFKEENPSVVYAIAMQWYCEWEKFARGRSQEPPGPIDNSTISVYKYGHPLLKQSSDYGPISSSIWNFFCNIYGGGPELVINYGSPKKSHMNNSYEDKAEVEDTLCTNYRSLSTDNLSVNTVQERVIMTSTLRHRTVSDGEINASAVTDTTSPRKKIIRYGSHNSIGYRF